MADGDVLSITISDDTAAGGSEGSGFGGVIVVDNTGGTYSASATTATTGIKVYRNLPAVRKWYADDTHWQPIKSFGTPVVNGSTLEVPFDLYVPIDSDLTVKVDAPSAWLTEGGTDAAAISMVTATNSSTRTIDRRYASLRDHEFKGNKYANVTALNTAGGLNFKATTVVERQQIRVDVRNFSATGGSAWRDVEYRWTFEESNTGSPTLGNDAHWDTPSWAMTYENKATGATVNQATEQIGPMAALDVLGDGGAGNQIRVTCTPITHNAGTLTTQTPVQAAVTITPRVDTTRQWFSSTGDNANDGRDFVGLGTRFNYNSSTKQITAISGTPFSGVTLYGDVRDDAYLAPIPSGQSTAEVYLDNQQDAFSTGSLPNLGVGSDFTLTSGTIETDPDYGQTVIRDPRGSVSATSATTGLTVVLIARNNNGSDVWIEGHNSSNVQAWRLSTFNVGGDLGGFAIWNTSGTRFDADWSASLVHGASTPLRAFVARYDGTVIQTRFDAGLETDQTATTGTLRTADNITIGSAGDGSTGLTSQGRYAFVGVWNSYLSTDTVELIEAVTYSRLGRSLPSGHTYEGVTLDVAYRRLASVDSSAIATLESGWTVNTEIGASTGPLLDTAVVDQIVNDYAAYAVGNIDDPGIGLLSDGTTATARRRIMGLGETPPIFTATTTLELSQFLSLNSQNRTDEAIEFVEIDGNGNEAYIRFDDVSSNNTIVNTGIRDVSFYNTTSQGNQLRAGSFLSRASFDVTGATASNRQQVDIGYKEYATITDVNVAGYADEGVLAHGLYPSKADAHQFRGLYFDELHTGANYCLNWDAGNDVVKTPSPYKLLSQSRLGNAGNGFDVSAQSNTRHEDGGDDNPHQFVVVEDNVIGPCNLGVTGSGHGTLYYVCDDLTVRRCVFYGCKTAAIVNDDPAGALYAYDNDIYLTSADGSRAIDIVKSANEKPHQIHGNRIQIDAAAPRVFSCSFTAMAAAVTAGATFSDNLVYVPNDASGGKIIYDRDTTTAKTVAEFETAVGLTGGTSFTIVDTQEELGWTDPDNLDFSEQTQSQGRSRDRSRRR